MFALLAALLIDALVGERPWTRSRIPHPVVVMGRGIDWADRKFNQGRRRRLRGLVVILVLSSLWGGAAAAVSMLPGGSVVDCIGASILIAHRSLVDHVTAVAQGLRRSLDDGRAAVGMIVGRDPQALDEAGVARAAIESAAENFSDGVAAPIFWFVIAGLPGIVVYKLVNTADSMIGHRTERYLAFGWGSARLDDLLNLVPARLTGVVFAIVALCPSAFRTMLRDAPHHRSPNAGWPEAAMARSLSLALAGPRIYAEGVVDDPFMNAAGRRAADENDIMRAVAILWRAWWAILAAAVAGVALAAL